MNCQRGCKTSYKNSHANVVSSKPAVDRLRIAQEYIEIITDPSLIPDSLFYLAGKFFKRFDSATCTFVSNIKEYYPDD